MRFVFVMDPPETVIYDEDTSFALMLEAQSRGHRVDHCLMQDLFLHEGRVYATLRRALLRDEPERPMELRRPEQANLQEVEAVFIRTDPPFNNEYLWGTLILEHLRGKTFVINDPRGLREANEKLYACHFPHLMPETLVSNDRERIKAFVRNTGGAVIKPIDGAGGEGVMMLAEADLNLNAIIESATCHGRRQVMVQEYLPQVRQGDKRILLLDSQPLGAISRIARAGELRSNIHVGGEVVAARLDGADRCIIEALKDRLQQDGLYLVGLDIIGGKLTEINVTSPTGIQQMSRLNQENLSARVIDWVENRIREPRQTGSRAPA